MHQPFATVAAHQHRGLLNYLCAHFPRTDPEHLRDALQDAFLDALERPHAFERAFASGGEANLFGLMRCVAWRKARRATQVRPHAPLEALAERAQPAGQALATTLALRVETAVRDAVQRFGHGQKACLRQALEYRIASGCTDTEAAERFNIPREYVNRAFRHVRREVVDQS
jgi:DNA-directed RNA polymerase specialized sigma24 family protein